MHVFEMVLGIVFIGVFGAIVISKNAMKYKSSNSKELKAMHSKLENLEALEERIAVLESIVTDNKFELSREIEGLKTD